MPSSDPDTKVLLLGLWVAWFLVLFTFLVWTEYIRHSIDDGLELSAMPEPALRRAMTVRYRARRAAAREAVVRHPLASRVVGGTPGPPSSGDTDLGSGAGQGTVPDHPGSAQATPGETAPPARPADTSGDPAEGPTSPDLATPDPEPPTGELPDRESSGHRETDPVPTDPLRAGPDAPGPVGHDHTAPGETTPPSRDASGSGEDTSRDSAKGAEEA
ncbi:MAG: hypothetical protein ACTJGR_10855 [Pauljensenia sp.]